jgi:hypothetical protein
MDKILFILMMLEKYDVEIPDGTTDIELTSSEIIFHGEPYTRARGWGNTWESTCISEFEFDNERLSVDNYQYNFTDETFPIDAVLAKTHTYAEESAAFELTKQAVVAELAFIASILETNIARGRDLAEKFGLPFMVGGADFRLLDAVDWDSSSMYC